ncbi:DUF4118 domain-containing protein [Peptacetobacter sp.]|uniref:DUF4118 domain-containing protein n=1 Tax=Peptacetobacter sp. TaxID=2991975 RepID=UPI0026154355|nr:DUF4118 domain-containing protein [Peptacetobacter sp.]
MIERNFYKDKKAKLYHQNEEEIHLKSYVFGNGIRLLISLGTMTAIALFFEKSGMDNTSIIVLYVMAAILTARFTEGYIFGTIASVVSIFIYNFLFIAPRYTFSVEQKMYTLSFIVMVTVSLLASGITSKLKKRVEQEKIQAKKMEMLYNTDGSFLKARDIEQVIENCGENLVNILGKTVLITIADERRNLMEPHVYICNSNGSENLFRLVKEREVIKECFRTAKPKGIGVKLKSSDCENKLLKSESNAYYVPIKGNYLTLGVIGVACYKREILSDEEKKIIKIVAEQTAIALERENIYTRRHRAIIEGEGEKLVQKINRITGSNYATLDDFLYDNSTVNKLSDED